jgi:hypothetical protein
MSVVELLVLVPADDVLRLEGFDHVDCLSPSPEAADDHTLREIHVTAVVDHVPRDNQPEVRHVQNAGIGAVGVADLHDHEVVLFELKAVVRDRDGVAWWRRFGQSNVTNDLVPSEHLVLLSDWAAALE